MDKSKFLASNHPVAREVTFSDGTVETLHFKQVTAGEFREWHSAERDDSGDARFYAMQRLIGKSLCNPDGSPALIADECLRLSAKGVEDLFPHVMAAAGVNKDASEKKA